ncbi:MAG: restriction endonuclease [bacterium]
MSETTPEQYGLTQEQVDNIESTNQALPTRIVIAGVSFGIIVTIIYWITSSPGLGYLIMALFIFGLAGLLIGIYFAAYQPRTVERILSLVSAERRKYYRYSKARGVQSNEQDKTRQAYWLSLDRTDLVKQVAQLYAALQYTVTPVPPEANKGFDLLLQYYDENIIMNCASQNELVDQGAVDSLFQWLIETKAHKAYFVSVRGFTEQAKEFAKDKPIRLITGQNIVELVGQAARSQ